jgi:hypothetical protein
MTTSRGLSLQPRNLQAGMRCLGLETGSMVRCPLWAPHNFDWDWSSLSASVSIFLTRLLRVRAQA